MNFSLSHIFDSFIRRISKSFDKVESFANAVGRKKMLWIFAFLFCFAIMLFLNVLTPMIADDFVYLYIFGQKEEVANLGDIIESQVAHYNMWGGRSVVHFIAQALLQMPRYVVDVLNSIMYLLFVWLIYLHIKGKDKGNSLSLFVLINLAAWFILPMFGDTVLWVTGSANYLWGTVIILLFLLPYRLYEGENKPVAKQIGGSALMLIGGVIAGWTNENSVVGMIVIMLFFLWYYRSQKWSIPIPYIIGLLSVIAGFILMIMAPGNFKRGGDSTELSLFIVLYRIITHTQNLILYYGYLILFYLIVAVLYRRFGTKKVTVMHYSLIYMLGGFAAIYAMVLSPQFPARAWFGLATFFLIAIGIVLYQLDYKEKVLRQLRAALMLVGGLAFLFSFYLATKDIYKVYQIDKEREILAKEARDAGAEKCYFKMILPTTSYVHTEDGESNLLLSYYYGIYIEFEGR